MTIVVPRYVTGALAGIVALLSSTAMAGQFAQTPYEPQKVVFDFYFNEPQAINSALYWVRGLLNPLSEHPYDYAPEQNSVVIVLHGMEIVTLAKHNYQKYQQAVERMRYYAELGVTFKVCGLALPEYHYAPHDLYEFVEVVPSAITELVHWQSKGHALIRPQIMEKIYAIDQIR